MSHEDRNYLIRKAAAAGEASLAIHSDPLQIQTRITFDSSEFPAKGTLISASAVFSHGGGRTVVARISVDTQ